VGLQEDLNTSRQKQGQDKKRKEKEVLQII
jgi:hypothetical protein